jgi:hypothetical protein
MRNPTAAEISKFERAAKALDELGRAGFRLYLANDTLNLMTGPSHDDNGHSQQDRVKAEYSIRGASGGDW